MSRSCLSNVTLYLISGMSLPPIGAEEVYATFLRHFKIDLTLVDVVLPTKSGIEIRKRCVTQPTEHQQILLQRLGLQLPQRLEIHKM
jgi:hypothetical protein